MILLRNKKRFLKIFILTTIFFFLLFGTVSIYNIKIKSAQKTLLNINHRLISTGCLIKTLGQNTESVSANISFYDSKTKTIGSYERAWQGWELKIECIVMPLKNGALVFPHRIFSNQTKYGTGVILFSYYNKNDYPATYDYNFFSKEEKEAIKILFKMARFSPYLFKFFSDAKAQTIDIREFDQDREYHIFLNSKKEIYLTSNY